jgi:hypothetical protein
LRIRGKVIGVLYVDNRVFAGQFSQQKLDLLEAFASQAAIAIHNAQLFGQTDEALKQRIKELEGVHRELKLARERAEKRRVLRPSNAKCKWVGFCNPSFCRATCRPFPGGKLLPDLYQRVTFRAISMMCIRSRLVNSRLRWPTFATKA